MIQMIPRKAPHEGYQVRIPADNDTKRKEILTWLRRRKIELDKTPMVPEGWMRAIETNTWDPLYIIYIKKISDRHRLLLKLTFCG